MEIDIIIAHILGIIIIFFTGYLIGRIYQKFVPKKAEENKTEMGK